MNNYTKTRKTYYQRNKEEIKRKVFIRNQTPKYKYNSYITSANSRNIEFKLTFTEFNEYYKKDCHYCGNKITAIGLDRMDNSKGYINGNIVSCCKECNFFKKSLSYEEFINKCKKIAKLH